MKTNVIFLISTLVLALLLTFSVSTCDKAEKRADNNEEAISILKDNSVKTEKDAEGRVTAIKQVAMLERETFLKVLAGKDEQLANLQASVKAVGKGAVSGTAIRLKSTVKAVGKTDSAVYANVPRGTLPDSVKCPLPTYYGKVSGFAYRATIEAGPDSMKTLSESENDLTVVTEKKGGFFKKKKTFVHIKSYNPDSQVTQSQSFEQPETGKSAVFWTSVGAGIGAVILVIVQVLVPL